MADRKNKMKKFVGANPRVRPHYRADAWVCPYKEIAAPRFRGARNDIIGKNKMVARQNKGIIPLNPPLIKGETFPPFYKGRLGGIIKHE